MSTIGFGVIGCGGISNAHLGPLSKRDDARIVCVSDINPEAARGQAEKYGAEKWVTDARELLAMPEVDAVVVCTPTFLHPEGVLAAAAAGKHILCEKPIALSLEDADRMIAACDKAGVLFMIAFVRRFCSEWLKLRDIIQSGEMGRPVLWRGVSGSSGPHSPWFLDAEKGGGPFIDGCVHDWDFARFTFGEPEVVLASVRHMKEGDSTSLDTGSAIIRFQSGDELMRSWTWGLPGRSCRAQGMHDVIGPKGALRFPGAPAAGSSMNQFVLTDGDGVEHALEYPHAGGPDWFAAQMDHFISCIKEGKQPSVTGEDGKKAIAIALAVLEAGRTHKPVVLG